MPDLVKEIYITLEEMQAAGGLGGGGGGAADVSTLATEVTLATVAVNTAATTTAIGQLETNVITASGVQTLSLNSATSAQTTTLGTAIGATNTALGTLNTTTVPAVTTAVQAVKTSVDALKAIAEVDATEQALHSAHLLDANAHLTAINASIQGVGSSTSATVEELQAILQSTLQIANSNGEIASELLGFKTATEADALIQANTNTLIDNMDSNLYTVANYAPHLESISTATSASADSLVEVSTKLDTLNTNASADYTLQGLLLAAAQDYGTVVDVIRLLLQEVIPATDPTQTSVSSSATSVTLVAANLNRRSLTIFNNSNSHLFICKGATATQATAICRVDPYGYYEMPTPRYLGAISGIWESEHGNASIHEGV